ncbi:hypothetical protein JQ633_07595 [Bradyrhizobium tropiciagri]|uniref:hypothetical protein n=1 Tax=Bradyrhizobium tropiciagri TaxID=312253 RepID=UPI001BAD09F3|nr:hypothetical protein [Bradyrhizobium tropiciagri]MBR0870215.1 hypothetical protein [Bradyrhizobium tropiciagri]
MEGSATTGAASTALAPAELAIGDSAIVGTAGTPLTPRLPISVDANGIPVRSTPPGAIGAVAVGVDEAAMLVEPEPHIPDSPAVSNVSVVVDSADVPRGSDELEIPDIDDPDIDMLPDIASLADPGVAAAPIPIPPPSKDAVDPNMVAGAVPVVEHAVPLLVLGIVIVPVTPVGAGLSPPEMISVAPSPIPVGPTAALGAAPSGDVTPRVGVVGNVPTCALASLPARSAGSITAINAYFILPLSCRDL